MIREVNEDDHRDEESHRACCSTACWRRYLGSWEIKDKRLYLCELTGRWRMTSKKPIFADWFSGLLCVPEGELLTYVHLGFASVFEQELLIDIEDGIVLDSWIKDNRGKVHDVDALAEKYFRGEE